MTNKEFEIIRSYTESPSPSAPLQKALRKLLQNYSDIQELEQKLQKAVEALRLYANWANYTSEGNCAHWDSEPVALLGDIEHKPSYVCGKNARQALKEIKGD